VEMTQKTTSREKNQENVENALANLGTSRRVLRMVWLRINQAINMFGAVDLLNPALDDITEAEERVAEAQHQFSEFWDKGQKNGWWE